MLPHVVTCILQDCTEQGSFASPGLAVCRERQLRPPTGKWNSSTRWWSVIVPMYSAPCIALLDRKVAFVHAMLTIVYCYILLKLCHGGKARRHENSIPTARLIQTQFFFTAAANASLTVRL